MTVPIVSVRGEATVEVEPERATFSVALIARERDRAEALRQLQQRAEEVAAALDAFGEAIEGRGTEAIRVNPVYKDGRFGDKVTAYTAATRTTVHVRDLTAVGDVVTRLSALGLVDLAGPWWSLRPDSPVFRDARTAAVQDAVRRAREYAAALRTDLDGLLELADTGLLSGPADGQVARPMAIAAPAAAPQMFRGGGGAAPPPPVELDLEPVRQTVRASVEARFTLRPPDLAAV